MEPLGSCCQREADRNLDRPRAVATCDECGRLLLAYGSEQDFERTVAELTELDVAFRVGRTGALRVIAKDR